MWKMRWSDNAQAHRARMNWKLASCLNDYSRPDRVVTHTQARHKGLAFAGVSVEFGH